MRLSQVIRGVRDKISDQSNLAVYDGRISYWIYQHSLSIFREMVDAHLSYVNLQLAILGTSPSVTALNDRRVRYQLPRNVYRVRRVDQGATGPGVIDRAIPHIGFHDQQTGWTHVDNYAIETRNIVERDITLQVARTPPAPHAGTLVKVGTADELYLAPASVVSAIPPSDPTRIKSATPNDAFLFHDDPQSYLGIDMELTGLDDAVGVRAPSGQIRQVAAASREWDATAAAWLTKLTLDQAWTTPPVVGDTYEMHLDVPTEHMLYLILLVARSILDENVEAAGFILADEMKRESAKFLKALQPRQEQGLDRVIPNGVSSRHAFDQDRDPAFLL